MILNALNISKEIIKFNDFFQQPLSIVALYLMQVSHIYTLSPLLLISWHLDDFFRFFVNEKHQQHMK